ncbi:MAG: 2-phospho-L-lactate guanylyltransferase [Pseudomonadales bacterium]
MPASKGLCVVIPMKNPQHSKQRLSSVLDSSERQSIAMILFSQTLAFLREHFSHLDVLVVTPSQRIADFSQSFGAKSLLHREGGLNGSLSAAAAWCRHEGYSGQLTLPADIVELDAEELQLLIDSTGDAPCVTLCPADDGGTNALLTSPADVISFSYGYNSSKRHADAARAQGITPQVLTLPLLAFDLDTPCDYQQLCERQDLSASALTQHNLPSGRLHL